VIHSCSLLGYSKILDCAGKGLLETNTSLFVILISEEEEKFCINESSFIYFIKPFIVNKGGTY